MFKKTIAAMLALMWFTSLTVPALATLDTGQYPFYQDLAVTAADTYNIELNEEVLKRCRDDMGDIRLADQQGGEIPYYLDTYQSPADILTEAEIINDDSSSADFHQVLIDSRDDHLSHNGILVDIYAERGLSGDVLIEGSYNNEDFEDLAMNRLYAEGGQTSVNELIYPIKKYRYLRLTITGDDTAEMKIRRIQYLYRAPQDQSVILLSARLVNSVVDSASQASGYIVDLGVKNLTVHNVLVQHTTTDFSRLVNVYESNNGEDWQLIAQKVRIFDYRWDQYSARNDSIEVNRSAGRFLKVEIIDDSEPQLDVTGINVLGMVPRLTATLQPGRYRLYYGNPDESTPEYAKQPLTAGPQASHPVLEAGRQTDNPVYIEPSGYTPSNNNNNLIVNLILLACFLMVAYILFRNIRRSLVSRR